MKMEQTECSETSAYKIQTPGNYPEENIQQALSCSYKGGRTLNGNEILWLRLYSWSHIMEQFPFGILMKPYGWVYRSPKWTVINADHVVQTTESHMRYSAIQFKKFSSDQIWFIEAHQSYRKLQVPNTEALLPCRTKQHIRVTESFKCQIQKHCYLVEQSCSQAFPIFWGSIWQNMI